MSSTSFVSRITLFAAPIALVGACAAAEPAGRSDDNSGWGSLGGIPGESASSTSASGGSDSQGVGDDGTGSASAGTTKPGDPGSNTEGVAGGTGDATSDSGTATATSTSSSPMTTTGPTTGTTTTMTGGEAMDPCSVVDVVLSMDASITTEEEIQAFKTLQVFDLMANSLLTEVGDGGIEDFHLGIMNACPKPARYHNWGILNETIPVNCNYPDGLNYLVSTKDKPLMTGPGSPLDCVTQMAEDYAFGYNNLPQTCLDNSKNRGYDDNEQPAFTAAQSVVDPVALDANKGFLRTQKDSILFVIAMTDEDEETKGYGTVQGTITVSDIVDMYALAKGDIRRVVFLGIAGNGNCSGPYGDAEDAPVMKQIVAEINRRADPGKPRALFWNICQGQFDEAVRQALSLVSGACDDVGGLG